MSSAPAQGRVAGHGGQYSGDVEKDSGSASCRSRSIVVVDNNDDVLGTSEQERAFAWRRIEQERAFAWRRIEQEHALVMR